MVVCMREGVTELLRVGLRVEEADEEWDQVRVGPSLMDLERVCEALRVVVEVWLREGEGRERVGEGEQVAVVLGDGDGGEPVSVAVGGLRVGEKLPDGEAEPVGLPVQERVWDVEHERLGERVREPVGLRERDPVNEGGDGEGLWEQEPLQVAVRGGVKMRLRVKVPVSVPLGVNEAEPVAFGEVVDVTESETEPVAEGVTWPVREQVPVPVNVGGVLDGEGLRVEVAEAVAVGDPVEECSGDTVMVSV